MTVFKIPGVTDAASIMCLITSSLSSDLVRAAEQGEGRVAFWGGRTCTAHRGGVASHTWTIVAQHEPRSRPEGSGERRRRKSLVMESGCGYGGQRERDFRKPLHLPA